MAYLKIYQNKLKMHSDLIQNFVDQTKKCPPKCKKLVIDIISNNIILLQLNSIKSFAKVFFTQTLFFKCMATFKKKTLSVFYIWIFD